MVESWVGEYVQDAAASPGLGVFGAEHHPRHPCQHDRPGAHRARLERHIQRRVEHPPAPERAGRLAQGNDLGVGGGVLSKLPLVVAGTYHLAALAHHDRADRHVVVFQRTLGLAERQAHEVLVAFAHGYIARDVCDSASRRHVPRIIITYEMHPRATNRCRPAAVARRTVRVLAATILALGATAAARGPTALADAYTPYAADRIVVGYSPSIATTASDSSIPAYTRVIHLGPGEGLAGALSRLRHRRGVRWAVPDYRAHTAGALVPDDPGTGSAPGDWQQLQWNLAGPFSVDAPEAWANLNSDGAPGGKGVTVAVLDTGVAYANRGRFRRSPDFGRFEFVQGYDFVAHNRFPNDRNGHGTFVAATIAEATSNGYGLTGLAFGAHIMPVRVLDRQGEGEASTIAKGVRFAVRHGAQVINLSLEFSPGVTASDIPELIEAIRFAHRHGVLVVAAAGNEGHTAIAYPARGPDVVSVGATTEHGCLAAYSNDGAGLTLAAPGGGPDANLPGDPNCHPEQPSGRNIYQITFLGSSPRRFGIPSGYEGTSMATPHVAAVAALIIASGVLGRHPTPAQITGRLRATAKRLGGGGDERLYGAGLVDAAAATAPGGPGAA
jgi:serine protease